MDSEILLADLRRDEGLRLHAYPDPLTHGAPYTVGYGHCGPEVTPSTSWTLAQAEAALEADVARAMRALDRNLPWWRSLDPVRAAVLVNMTFNMGIGRLEGFVHTLKFIRARDWEPAAEGMLASAWARQVGARAARLAEQMRTGVRA